MSESMERINTDAAMRDLIAKWRARGSQAVPPRPSVPPPPRPTDARLVRIGWYIPPRHENDTFETYRPQNASQRAALEAARSWAESVIAGEGATLALTGSVGTGKSHLLYAAVRAVNLAGLHCAAAGWYDLADLFREAKFGDYEDVSSARVRKARFMGSAAFGIDEIRPTSRTDFDVTELSQLMTRAYREKQGVFVTSNHSDEKLERIIGLAAASRLTQVKVVGPDMRKPENHVRLKAG